MEQYFGASKEMVLIHSNQRLDNGKVVTESVLKFNEPQQNQRVYTLGQIKRDVLIDDNGWLMNTGIGKKRKNIYHLETTKIFQDVFSEYPFMKPIVDYWIFASPQGTEINRETFSMFDLFAHIGGLLFFTKIAMTYFVSLVAGKPFSFLSASRLYTWKGSPITHPPFWCLPPDKVHYRAYKEAVKKVNNDLQKSLDITTLIRRLKISSLFIRTWLDKK